jgi:hypothetical protein
MLQFLQAELSKDKVKSLLSHNSFIQLYKVQYSKTWLIQIKNTSYNNLLKSTNISPVMPSLSQITISCGDKCDF